MEYTYHEQVDIQNVEYIRNICNLLPQYVKTFFRGIQQTHSSRSRLMYAREIQHFFEYIVEVYDKVPLESTKDVSLDILSDIDAEFILDYMDYLQKYVRDGRIYTNNRVTIKRKLAALSVFYKFLYKHGHVTNNPISKVDFPKLHEKAIVRMEANEVADFLDNVEFGSNLTFKQQSYHTKSKNRDLALLTLMLSTGIRISECVGLDIGDIDFNNMCIKVIRKGGKEAIVYFSDEAGEALGIYMDERKKIEAVTGHSNALFLSSHKKRISVRAVENLVKKYAQSSVPLKKITPHKLRSTYGTALYQETDDIYLVADVLGHSDVNTTKKHYADIDNNRRRSARNKVTLREKMD